MKEIAVQGAKVRCSHGMGYARPSASRGFVRIEGRGVLVDVDMPFNGITFCPNIGPTTKPCTLTAPLVAGLSDLVFAGGRPVVLDQARGPTDGIPPGITTYSVKAPGQTLARTRS